MPPTARDPTTSRSSEDGQRFTGIVEQARAGDKTAFDTLFQRNRRYGVPWLQIRGGNIALGLGKYC